MSREMLGGFPIEIEKSKDMTRIKFYPKNPNAKHPDHPVLILEIGQTDKKKLFELVD